MELNLRQDRREAAVLRGPVISCADHPFISIILCTLGHRSSLQKCLDSLAAQDCTSFEILLVLNREGEAPALRVPDHVSYRLLRELRPGVCAARNCAIPEARGEILVFVDDDVVAHDGWLHQLLQGFADPQVACVTGRVIPEGPGVLSATDSLHYYFGPHAVSPRAFDPSDGSYEEVLNGRVFGVGCNMAFRRSFLQAYSRFPEDLGTGSVIGAQDDNYMLIQVLRHGFRIHYNPHAQVTHFFEDDVNVRKVRRAQLCASGLALRLKLLAEDDGHRTAILKNSLNKVLRFLRIASGQAPVESRELLSPAKQLLAYMNGIRLYWKARRR